MDDLISKSASLAEMELDDPDSIDAYNEWRQWKNRIEHFTTVDAVPVVRCKDCKYWDCYGGEDSHKGDCLELIGLESCMYENDFCSYGERKENER